MLIQSEKANSSSILTCKQDYVNHQRFAKIGFETIFMEKQNSHCAAFPPPRPLTFLHVFGCCHALTQPDPKQSFKNTSYHIIRYLLESLADFLGLELTAEMFELNVRKFSLSDDVLWRLLPALSYLGHAVVGFNGQ